MRFRRRRWLLRWAAVAFAAAVLAPAAQAVPLRDESLSGERQRPAARPSSTATVSDGFSWADAGVGAAAAFSIVLVAGGGILVVRGSQRGGLADA